MNNDKRQVKNLRWNNLAFMAFAMVWGFANMAQNFALQGMPVVFSWVLILALYFLPYALMVGELGSVFQQDEGGVASWIKRTSTKRLAFFAGWTYWVVHIPYLAQRPQAIIIAWGWIARQDATLTENANPLLLQLICLLIFLIFLWLASKGIKILKTIGTIAGTATFVMSLLFIILIFAAPLLPAEPFKANLSLQSFIPRFDFAYLTTLSMLIFGVGGAEKISPYVKNTINPAKEFPKGMIALTVMIASCAILGSIAMGLMFQANPPDDLLVNGQYYAFLRLGEHYHLGKFFLVIYAIANLLAQISALVFSIDAPLRMLLADADDEFVPKFLRKTNSKGTFVRGYFMTALLASIIIIIPAFGIGNMEMMFAWLLNLNTVTMPIRYLWVFLAYIWLKRKQERFPSDYRSFKSKKWGSLAGIWCFGLTLFACILGMVPKGIEKGHSGWGLQLALNILTPLMLLGLGLILPLLAKKTKGKQILKR